MQLRANCKGASVTIEEIDDVAIIRDNFYELYQVKNFITSSNKITDYSIDIWKTLYNWAKKFIDNSINPTSEIVLFINSQKNYKSGDFLFEMNEIKTDVEATDFYNKIYDKYKNSTNKTIKKYIDFLFLDDNRNTFIDILKKFTLVDRNVDQLEILNEYISKYCTFGSQGTSMFEKARHFIIAEFQMIITRQSQNKDGITIDVEKFHDRIDKFCDICNNLSVLRSTTCDEDIDITAAINLSFIRQLEYIQIGEERLEKAKYDYYKTKIDVFNYLQDSLILDIDFQNFKKRLIRIWDGIKMDHNEGYSPSDAKKIFADCTKVKDKLANIPIEQDYFCIGSYHILVQDDCEMEWYRIKGVNNNE